MKLPKKDMEDARAVGESAFCFMTKYGHRLPVYNRSNGEKIPIKKNGRGGASNRSILVTRRDL